MDKCKEKNKCRQTKLHYLYCSISVLPAGNENISGALGDTIKNNYVLFIHFH